MRKTKTEDRHVEPVMTVYPVRLREDHLEMIRKLAKKEDRTRQSLIREAITEWLERRIQ